MATVKKSLPGTYAVKTGAKALQTARAPRDDLAVERLLLNDQKMSLTLTNLVTSLELQQTMDGASSLTLVIFDPDRRVLQSSLAATASVLTFDRVLYTLVGVEITDANLTLSFEETAVNVLRSMKGPVKANRYNTTRAQFIHSLVRQPKQYAIPFRAPEEEIKQPVAGGKVDVLKEANWITPSGGIRRSRTADQQASADTGGKGQGWITVGATTFSGAPGSCGTLGDGTPQYAELGSAGANAGMGPLLAPLFDVHGGYRGGLPCGFKLDVEHNGKVVTAKKGDIGSGQPETFYKIDLHTSLSEPLGLGDNYKGPVRIRRSA